MPVKRHVSLPFVNQRSDLAENLLIEQVPTTKKYSTGGLLTRAQGDTFQKPCCPYPDDSWWYR